MKGMVSVCYMCMLLFFFACGGGEPSKQESPNQKICPRGSLGFWFHIERDYYNGVEPQGDLVMLVEVPGIMSIELDTPSAAVAAATAAFGGSKQQEQEQSGKKPPSSNVNLEFKWLGYEKVSFFSPFILDCLPGPAWYYLAFRWDSAQGIFDGFLNGVPSSTPGAKQAPWSVTEQPVTFKLADSVEDFNVSSNFWTDDSIKSHVAERQHVDMAPRIGFADKVPMEDVELLKGKLLYAPDFSKKGTLDKWKMEGPGVTRTDSEGWLYMESAEANVGGPGDGHFVFWPPEVFSSDFLAEWDFQPQSDDGLCIVLFSATGKNGEHLFDPSLKARNGNFTGYINGDINCYHTSYYANPPINPGRTTSNMRKNSGFYIVANGPVGVPVGSRDIHRITLVKRGGHIQLGVDGDTIINWTDDGVQYGPVLGSGQIGFRQMKWLKARYRNFSVWTIK